MNDYTTSLCKKIRAVGVPKKVAHQLVNEIQKWISSNGVEWTNSRLKDLKQWYETYLAGNPIPPAWFKHGKDNLPLGIFKYVFELRNQQKALSILSVNTLFIAEEILGSQRTKFLEAVNAGPLEQRLDLSEIPLSDKRKLPDLKSQLSVPGYDAITGKSIPVGVKDDSKMDHLEAKKLFLRPVTDSRNIAYKQWIRQNKSSLNACKTKKEKTELLKAWRQSATQAAVRFRRLQVCNAYVESWENVPTPTLEYLRREGRLELVPPALLTDDRDDGSIFATIPTQDQLAGSIGVIQQEALKARWVANPNRISQSMMGPLGDHWYNILRSLPTDCTFNQEAGMSWVQDQLRHGVCLAGTDLSSATDLLDRQLCLEIITRTYLGRDWNLQSDWVSPVETSYRNAVDHFMQISAMEWTFPEGGTVSWDRGQPLGAYPSFAMLALTNNALGRQACLEAGIPLDSFRVLGDDFIIDARAVDKYCSLVERLGGSINHSKTLTSDRCAEFAGRVITPQRVMNKTVKFKEMSDNSFMSLMAGLGDQAKSLLRPRQRKQYELFKFIPGIAVDGPYSQNSFGYPLNQRYAWYLDQVEAKRVLPEKEYLDSWQFASEIYYFLSEEDRADEFELAIPFTFSDDFQSSLATAVAQKGDPRLTNGKTCLEALEEISSSPTFQSFKVWIESEVSKIPNSELQKWNPESPMFSEIQETLESRRQQELAAKHAEKHVKESIHRATHQSHDDGWDLDR